VIRLGSLAGYPFEGPRLLGGWTAPARAAVYAIMYRPDPVAKPDHYAPIYIGHADDLAALRLPFSHPRASCWIKRAGAKWQLYICVYEVPGGTSGHREQITRELIARYRPGCNDQQYAQAWKDEWIANQETDRGGGLLRGDDDAVFADLAVNRGSGHAQRDRRLDLVAPVGQQALDDGVPFHGL